MVVWFRRCGVFVVLRICVFLHFCCVWLCAVARIIVGVCLARRLAGRCIVVCVEHVSLHELWMLGVVMHFVECGDFGLNCCVLKPEP